MINLIPPESYDSNILYSTIINNYPNIVKKIYENEKEIEEPDIQQLLYWKDFLSIPDNKWDQFVVSNWKLGKKKNYHK